MALNSAQFTQLLIAVGVSPSVAKDAAEPLRAAMALYNISTPEEVAGFLGQVMVESGNLTHREEGMYYTTMGALKRAYGSRMEGRTDLLRNPKALAIVAYGGRLGNSRGPSTDGWDYRGSGLIQTTGRTNFTALEKATGLKVVSSPDLLRKDWSAAAVSACYFFTSAGCMAPARLKNWDVVTRKVNGPAMLEKEKRASISNKVLREYAKL